MVQYEKPYYYLRNQMNQSTTALATGGGEEIGVVKYLVSDEASFVTGSITKIDIGMNP